METEATEVEFEDALAEEANANEPQARPAPGGQAPPQTQAEHIAQIPQNFDQAEEQQPKANEQAQEQAQEDQEILVPKTQAREWVFGQGDNSRKYIQEELSVIGEVQWFSLLGEFLDKALGGENAISLNALLSPPQRRGSNQLQIQDFQDADTFVHALGKLVSFAPEFIEKSICIWLSVPDYEWELVRAYMKLSPKRGGMSHEDFEEIIATFIDQNYIAIDRFFRERYGRLRARYLARAKEASQSRSSKR